MEMKKNSQHPLEISEKVISFAAPKKQAVKQYRG
jgi:hypothetical protein